MKNYITLVCILFYLSSFSQKESFDFNKTYSVAQIVEDINYTEKYLTKFHPDPFKYISKDSLHAFILKQKEKIDSPLTEMQHRFYIKQIIAKIGCGHSDVAASKKYTNAIKKTNRPILPVNVFVNDSNQLFIFNNLSNDSTIKPGDEILSINNHTSKQILNTIYSIYTSDGFNTTYKKQGINYDWFKYYYSFCYGFKLKYVVKIKHQDSTITNYNLAAISSSYDTLLLPKKHSINYIRKTKTCTYSIMQDDKPIAVIDINKFKGWHWYSFVRKTFKDIKRKKIENLVIDLRDNGGGQINDGLNLLSYMIDQRLTLPFDRKANLMALNPKYKMGLASRVSPFIFFTLMPKWIVNGRLRHYFISFPKKRNAFKGQIYVLVNGKSFSMSSVVATYLKHKANATIIGEETGGNIAGSNAVLSGHITLPNSKIRVFIPMYHLYYNVNVENKGRGLMPDFPTNYTKDVILKGTDLDLQKVREIVN